MCSTDLIFAAQSERVVMFEYDVALSFAGEQRSNVLAVAECLKKLGVSVFYDDYEKANLWGKNLYDHLSDVYQNKARYCVIFASKEYAEKTRTNLERQNAQARALRDKGAEYILPVRFPTKFAFRGNSNSEPKPGLGAELSPCWTTRVAEDAAHQWRCPLTCQLNEIVSPDQWQPPVLVHSHWLPALRIARSFTSCENGGGDLPGVP
jgi:TIR domain